MATRMAKNPNASTGMSASAMAGITGAASGISSLGGAYAQKLSYDIQAIQSKTAAARARLQGNVDALELTKNFNKTQASNAVMAAAQGRKGGSVDAIASAAESQLNWDATFMKLTNDITYQQQMSKASGYKSAGLISMGMGTASAGVEGMKTAQKLYSIGGSTKDKK